LNSRRAKLEQLYSAVESMRATNILDEDFTPRRMLVDNLLADLRAMPAESGFADDVAHELARARAKHPTPIRSRHEGYGVLAEELREVESDVFTNQLADHLRMELIHVAAMAQRFADDLKL
jgi:hypothetical protein